MVRISPIRLIGPEGEQFGVISTDEARKKAQEAGLDLVEVAPTARPPVCRIMDFSKYKYEQEKREKEARKHQRVVHLKEVKFRPKIDEHDYQTKLKNLVKFIEHGDRCKITMMFRGREMAHIDLGRAVMDRLARELAPIAEMEKPPKLEGRNMTMIFIPKKGAPHAQA